MVVPEDPRISPFSIVLSSLERAPATGTAISWKASASAKSIRLTTSCVCRASF
eukprot:CAMPEP_0181265348 /NCGR_PEP_ID=MMETSP1097-20121128/3668_1 /TAXON_ID=35684 /ORGANISM="Pseudopedinella elastica, Strain CCMP716" /LENGTH=52 /DNA_ID=CAMNT_0023364401 /DNA_START=202 /DNA_END=360 /DNA_ORIENTATION=-